MAHPGLEAIEPWAEAFLAQLAPAERRRVFQEIGRRLRTRNAARIKANVQPDGSAMEPRKPRRDKRGRLRRNAKKGKMFAKTALARNMKITTREDEVELAFRQPVSGTAKVHHFGLVDAVDKTVSNSIRVRYPARRLLGIPAADREEVLDVVVDWLDKAGR